MSSMLIIGLAGMPGAGKSVVIRVARERGYGVLVMGNIVREEAKRRGLEPNPENMGKIMVELRRREGSTVISQRCIPRIKQADRDKLIIDGVRSLDEVEEFRSHFPKFTLVAVHSSPETRFGRLHRRGRSDDPEDLHMFRERDMRELNVGLGEVIAMAEYMIVNEGELETLREKGKEVLRRIEEKWTE